MKFENRELRTPIDLSRPDSSLATSVLELQTGCRIHFGLAELAEGQPRRYAGLGIMLAQPQLIVRVSTNCTESPNSTSPRLKVHQSISNELEHRIRQWMVSQRSPMTVEVVESFPLHCGLGTGTQLSSLLTIAGRLIESQNVVTPQWQPVSELFPWTGPDELAAMSARGGRSRIGVHGLLNGGLILDSGLFQSSESPSGLQRTKTYRMPESWRCVLIRASDCSGISGHREHDLIHCMAEQPNPHREEMWQLACATCEAAEQANFARFADQLEVYLEHAAQLFSPAQGGRFNGPVCELAASEAQAAGLRAVGQSSWGPTIFGFASEDSLATQAVIKLLARHSGWNIQVSSVIMHGARARKL